MLPITKLLIGTGIVLILIGIFWQYGGRFLPLGRLPGDIVIEKQNFRFYFPLMTSVALSVILSLLIYIFRYFSK
jgi:hypothetical protein